MTRNRGCFDRHDDEHNTPHEYASPPCYMHEVDSAYFGSLPAFSPTPDIRPEGSVPTDARASWTTLLGNALSRSMSRITSLTGSKDRD